MKLAFSIIVVLIISLLWGLSWNIDDVEINLANRFLLPSPLHPLGSDSLGRDLLSLIQLAVKDSVFPIWLAITASFLRQYLQQYFLLFFSMKD